jgi:hypothetical protein
MAPLRLFTCIVLGLGAGCSFVNDHGRHQGPDGVAPIRADDLCAILSHELCDARIRCCPDGVDETLEECRADSEASCRTNLQVFLEDPRTGYDPQVAGEVVARGVALAAECDPDIADWAVNDVLTVLRGTAVRGTTCRPRDADDLPALFQCRVEDNLVCRPEGSPLLSDWICQGKSAEGGPCVASLHCQDGLYCNSAGDLFIAGTCEQRLSTGASCTSNDQCATFVCDVTCQPKDTRIYCSNPLEAPAQ